MKKSFIAVLSTFCVAVIVITLLFIYFYTPLNGEKNGFERIIIKNAITQLKAVKISNSINRLTGITDDSIYLGTNLPGEFYTTNHALKGFSSYEMAIMPFKKLNTLFKTFVDDENVYIFGNNVPVLYSKPLKSNKIDTYFLPFTFGKCTPIGNNKYAAISYGKDMSDKFLSLVDARNQKILKAWPILETGPLSTDGMLHYDKINGRIIFVSYYTNQFITLDTNLQTILLNRTIDTISTYAPEIVHIENNGKKLIRKAEPNRISNRLSCVYGDLLYINSNLKGDNETPSRFKKNAAIDVYHLENGEYLGSFYIPDKRKMLAFKVQDSLLVVLFHSQIETYVLHLKG